MAALVSRGGENLEQARSQWNLSDDVCFSDLDAALATPADAVLVTVPHHLHVPVARKALEAGKHVLCEKPFSDDFDAAVDLVSFAESTQLQLAVSQNFRYRLGLWQLKALSESLGSVDSLRIELYQPQGRLPGWRADQVSTLALEIMIHHVDMARFLLGANAEQVFLQSLESLLERVEGTCQCHGNHRIQYRRRPFLRWLMGDSRKAIWLGGPVAGSV